MTRLLLNKLGAAGQKQTRVTAAEGLALAVAALVAALAIGMLLDWWLDLPWVVRAMFLTFYAGLAGWIIVRQVVVPILYAPDVETLALRVESAEPAFRSRLIASVQLGQPGAASAGTSPGLVAALVRQTEQFAQSVDFGRIVKTDHLLRVVAVAAALLAGGGAVMALGGQTAADLFQRALLSNTPVPRRTRVECESGNVRVARGDSVILSALAHGIIPDSGYAEATFASHVKQRFPLDPDPAINGRFLRTIENVQESFKYVVYLNDGYSLPYSVTVTQRPTPTSLECIQHYPPYVRKKPERKAPGDLSLLAGSQLGLRIVANKGVKIPAAGDSLISHVHLHGSNKDVPLEVDPADPTRLSALVPLPPLTNGFSIHLVDQDGVESKDPAVYRIELIPDAPPTVRVTWPAEREQLVTRKATIVIGLEATDDYLPLGRLELRYKQDHLGVKSIPLALDDSPEPVRRRFEWRLAKFAPPEGSVLEYWLVAEDTNNVTGPGRSESEHFKARVVSDAEKRAELLARLGGAIQQVGTIGVGEQQASEKLGDLILEKPKTPGGK